MPKIDFKLIPNKSIHNQGERAVRQRKMKIIDQQLDSLRRYTYKGWGNTYLKKVHKKSRYTSWERIKYLSDNVNDILPFGTFVNELNVFHTGNKIKMSSSAGVITVITRVHKLLVVVISNDNTVASGSWWPNTPQKIIKMQEIALHLCIPTIYLVDCSGLFLPEQRRTFSGKYGAGKIFKMNSLLSNKGVPQIAGVMGDCIAGGGYMPIISDKVYITESAYMVIAGGALIRGSKGQNIKSTDIGGPSTHVHQSHCADYRVPDDISCLNAIRQEISTLSTSGIGFYKQSNIAYEPLYSTLDLSVLLPMDYKVPYDILSVISRILDNSLFFQVMEHYGKEIITGIGNIGGLYVGLIANTQGLITEQNTQKLGGVLYQEGVSKMSIFSRTCNDDGIPIIWLQDVSGFDVGKRAEDIGLLSYGSNLIYTNSNNTVPMFTILLRKASGAGYYAMCGMPYDPIVQLCLPCSRLSVMDGKTLAIGTFRTKLDHNFNIRTKNTVERNLIKSQINSLEKKIERDMYPYLSANTLDVDEIIKAVEIRKYLLYLVEASYQSHNIRRVKNSRIWSLHDLQSISTCKYLGSNIKQNDKITINKPKEGSHKHLNDNFLIRSPMDGIFYTKPSPHEPEFVKAKQEVTIKDTLGLLEVMKNFYTIRLDNVDNATIESVAKNNAVAVKKGDVLFILRDSKTAN